MNKPLMLVKEVAHYLDKTPITLRRWRKNGKLPAFKMKTGGVRYDRSIVEEFKRTH